MGHGHGHGHGHLHGHGHGNTTGGGQRHTKRLTIAFGLALGYFVVEATFALLTGSLTLLADAGHMLTDTVGLGMALAAITVATRAERSGDRTFGLYRLEVLAALANAALLFAVAAYVLVRALLRMGDPVHLPTHQLLFVAVIGLAVNFAGFLLLRDGAKDNLNLRAAYLEVVADAIGSVAVIVAAVLIVVTGWAWVDPAFALALALFIVPRTLHLGAMALRVLLQAAPQHIDVAAVERDLRALPGVTDVRDLHVWTLTSSMEVVTAHLGIRPGVDGPALLRAAEDLLQHRYGLGHTTLQLEPDPVLALQERWCLARPARDPVAAGRGRHRRSS